MKNNEKDPYRWDCQRGSCCKGDISHKSRPVLKKSGQENSRHRKLLVERSVARKSLVSPFEERKQRPV